MLITDTMEVQVTNVLLFAVSNLFCKYVVSKNKSCFLRIDFNLFTHKFIVKTNTALLSNNIEEK